MALGFGANSSLLNALVGSKQIAARTWGMFWGRTGASPASQMDGSLVLGGYDRAKTTGQKFVQSLTGGAASCGSQMLVSILDISINFPNGTVASIFPPAKSTAMAACIDPSYPGLMTLGLNPYFQNFQTLVGSSITSRSFGLNWYNMRFDAGMPV